MARQLTDQAKLRKVGFEDPTRALTLLEVSSLAGYPREQYLECFASVPDPDQALLALIRLSESCKELPLLARDEETITRLLCLLGMSSALGDFLISHPERVRTVLANARLSPEGIPSTSRLEEREHALRAVGADPRDDVPCSNVTLEEGINLLRAHYMTRVARLASFDLSCPDPEDAFVRVGESMSHIVSGALEGALALVRGSVPDAHKVGLAIIAMGKTGACELNYISDVDVVFVARTLPEYADTLSDEDMLAIATRLATGVGKVVSAPAGEPALWVLDAGLRPEGKDGPLVRTLPSYQAYYQRWAKGWEFQALLKARPVAGDAELGQAYMEALWPLVWQAAGRENFVEDSRAMRRRVEAHVPARDEARQLKLGKGGLRDVEFTVQLLQLVHGRTDESLHVRSTLSALAALRDGGYVARHDAAQLDKYYRFLRALEHRIQLQHLRRSHLVPRATQQLRRIARSLHLASPEDLERAWMHTRSAVRALHQEIYYRPLLPEAAKLTPEDISLQYDAAVARLAGIGYRDPKAALDHIRALTGGISRTAAIQRQLLPVMIGWFATGAEPDNGLRAFRVLSEQMGRTSWYLRTLRDGGAAAERLCYILASSRYVAENIAALPESISWLVDSEDLKPLDATALEHELTSLLSRRTEPEAIAAAGRYLRRRELLRTAMGQTMQVITPRQARKAISGAADIAVKAALQGARTQVEEKHGSIDCDVLVVALGRMGGNEMGYASDADLLVVYEPHEGADAERAATIGIDLASTLKHLLTSISEEPPLPADFDLRPEGRQGVLARSLTSYEEYYSRWALTWERQALLRARPCAGSSALAEKFTTLIAPYRYPQAGLDTSEITDIRKMKARVERERMPRGVAPTHHLKLGRGGLADVEWTVQLLQLMHAGSEPRLRVTSTLKVLEALAECGLITSEQKDILSGAWDMASCIRDANFLGTGRVSSTKIDVLPHHIHDLAVIAGILGKEPGHSHDIEEDYLRSARRARKLVEHLFYGQEELPASPVTERRK